MVTPKRARDVRMCRVGEGADNFPLNYLYLEKAQSECNGGTLKIRFIYERAEVASFSRYIA